MFQIERLQKIKQILLAQKSVSVMDLSEQLDVSEITIRRDFEKLEKNGFLRRTHGGAVLQMDYTETAALDTEHTGHFGAIPDVSERYTALGKICADIVEDYDVVFLGKCPSNLVMAKSLREKNDVVVITNYLDIVSVMNGDRKSKVLLTGGQVDYNKMIMRSSIGLPFIGLNVTKAFLHVQGLDFEAGVTVNDSEDKLIYEQLKQTAGEVIIVAEGNLFGKAGLLKVDDLFQITTVVTDDRIPDEYKSTLYRKGIQIYQKFDL